MVGGAGPEGSITVRTRRGDGASPPYALFDSDWLVAVVCGLVAAGLEAYRLTLHDVLFGVHGYGDGVVLGSAVRLVHGVVPYKDFVFTAPPGGTLLLSPLAALGRVIGTPDAMAAARCLAALAVTVNAGLAAWCLRIRGRAGMLAAGLGLATFPFAVTAGHTFSLEPFAALLCLSGILLIFAGETAPTRGRLVGGGLVFGLAGSMQLWAIVPAALALLLVVLVLRSVRFIIALVAGLLLPSLPFVALAPRAFAHQVLATELGKGAASLSGGVESRLLSITGLGGLTAFHAPPVAAVVLLAALAAVVLVLYVSGRSNLGLMEWFVLAASCLVVAEFLALPQFSDTYPYFSAVFLALLVGICVDNFVVVLDSWTVRSLRSPFGLGSALTVGVVAALAVILGLQARSFSARYLAGAYDPSALLDSQIPAGSCVLTDSPSLTLMSNRFTSLSPSCPKVDDTYGLWVSIDSKHPPPDFNSADPVLARRWQRWLADADYLVEVGPRSTYLPWSDAVVVWFSSHYRLVASQAGAYVYGRTG
jgi:hypothetical protein